MDRVAGHPSPRGRAHVGDWIEARGIYGQPPRRGQIIGLLGSDRHERYRVRWDEEHESILYPADGVVLVPKHRRPEEPAALAVS